MPTHFACPSCSATLGVPEGKTLPPRVRCPRCQDVIVVPAHLAGSPAPTPVPAAHGAPTPGGPPAPPSAPVAAVRKGIPTAAAPSRSVPVFVEPLDEDNPGDDFPHLPPRRDSRAGLVIGLVAGAAAVLLI